METIQDNDITIMMESVPYVEILMDEDEIIIVDELELLNITLDTPEANVVELGDGITVDIFKALQNNAKESTLLEESKAIKNKIANIDLTSVNSKVEEVGNKIDNIKLPEIDTTELAKESTLQEVKSSVEGIAIPLTAISGLALELEGGKKNIANALKARGIEVSAESDTLTDLAAKVYNVKNPVAFTVPAETSNDLANTIFNTMMQSQGYDKMYEEVKNTYCGDDGIYAGLLMTSLSRSSNTQIQLIGADAYYIYEEDIFYKTGENGKLVQFLNGVEVQLTTDKHLWDTTNIDPLRTVFYLYLPDSTADGNRENSHVSSLDYCNNTIIPCVQYKSNGGIFIHLHVANPDTCVIKWNGGSSVTATSNKRTIYFYSNVHNATSQVCLNGNGGYMYYFSLPELRNVSSSVCNSDLIKSFSFPKLELMTGGVLLNGYRKNRIILSFPYLKEINQGSILYLNNTESTPVDYIEVNLPAIENMSWTNINGLASNGCIIRVSKATNVRFILKDGVMIHGLIGKLNSNISRCVDNLYIQCGELYTTVSETVHGWGDIVNVENIYFEGLKKAILMLGGTSSYSPNVGKYFVNCVGGRGDEIKIVQSAVPNLVSYNLEISDGTRQPLNFNRLFDSSSADLICSNILEKLADNRYEDDGVTLAPAIKITLGSAVLNKLSTEQKAIATDKNYILA